MRILSYVVLLSASVAFKANSFVDANPGVGAPCARIIANASGYSPNVDSATMFRVTEVPGGYIRSYSFYLEDQKKLISDDISIYKQQLADFNERSDVNVYVLLINGITFGQTNHTIPATASVRDVMAWSDKDKFSTFPMNETTKEVSGIVDKVTKDILSDVKKAVVCALVEFDVQYGFNSAKRFTSYYSAEFGFDGSEGKDFRAHVDAAVAAAQFSDNQKANLSKLVAGIRQAGDDLLMSRFSADYDKLESYLLTIHEPLRMASVIKNIASERFLNFKHPLRAHVIRTLMKEYKTEGAPHYVAPQQVNYSEVVLALLKMLHDKDITSWHEYMRNPQNGRVLLSELINNFYDEIFGESHYQSLMKVFTYQLTLNSDYLTQVETLAKSEDLSKSIIWSDSYALKLFTTPPIGTTTYEVELNKDGMIRFTKQHVERWDTTLGFDHADWSAPEGPYTLHPFEPVQFINRSKLSMLANNATNDLTYQVVPAIYLLYAQQKEFNDNVGTGIEIGADVVTLAFPLTKIRWLGKLGQRIVYGVEIADKINSFVRLSANLGVGGTEFAEIAKYYNDGEVAKYVSYAGLSITAADAVTILGRFVKSVNAKKESLQRVAQGNQEVEFVLELSAQIDREAIKLRGKNWLDQISDLASVADKKLMESITHKVKTDQQLTREEIAFLRAKNFPEEYIDEVVPNVSAECQLDCAIGKYGCFAPRTLVSTANGQVAVEDVKEQMLVWSYNHTEKKKELKKVTSLKRYIVGGLLALGLSNGAEVQATDNHPFYTRGDYRAASELVVGDTLLALDPAKTIVIHSIRQIQSSDSVYNFTVADNANYYVGHDGVLVHNSCLAQTLSQEKFKSLHDKVNQLDDRLRQQFFSDFVNASEAELKTLNDNLRKIDAWKAISQHVDLRTNAEFIDKITSFSDDLLKQLNEDLLNAKYNLVSFFNKTPSDVVTIWKELKDRPAFAWEDSKTGTHWEAWKKREFFINVTAKGKHFETEVCLKAFKDRKSPKYLELKNKVFNDFHKDLDEYDLFSQVQLKYKNEDYFVADQIYVRFKVSNSNTKEVDDIIIIENKLNESTQPTTQQSNALNEMSFTVRSINVSSEFGSGNSLTSTMVLKFLNARQWYKVYDGAEGDVITGMGKM